MNRRMFWAAAGAAACGAVAVLKPTQLASYWDTSIASSASSGRDLRNMCSLQQGFVFSQDRHDTFGFIESLMIGDDVITDDIWINEPTTLATGAPHGGALLRKPVVGVLESTEWGLLASDNLDFQLRVSPATASKLKAMAGKAWTPTRVQIGFVVFQYDVMNQAYYSSFASHLFAVPQGGLAPAQNGAVTSTAIPIFGSIAKTAANTFAIEVGTAVQTDVHGIPTCTLNLTLAPIVAPAPQQILVQTSTTIKLIQPWGLPSK